MNRNLNKTVLDSRQFVGLLLLTCSIATLAIVMVVTAHPPDDSIQSAIAHYEAEISMVEKFGFLFPPLQSLIAPLLAVTAFLAAIFLWLSIGRGRRSYDS
jgi:hypothetical protein